MFSFLFIYFYFMAYLWLAWFFVQHFYRFIGHKYWLFGWKHFTIDESPSRSALFCLNCRHSSKQTRYRNEKQCTHFFNSIEFEQTNTQIGDRLHKSLSYIHFNWVSTQTKVSSLLFYYIRHFISFVNGFRFQWEFIFGFDLHIHTEDAYFYMRVFVCSYRHLYMTAMINFFLSTIVLNQFGCFIRIARFTPIDQVNFNSIFQSTQFFTYIFEIHISSIFTKIRKGFATMNKGSTATDRRKSNGKKIFVLNLSTKKIIREENDCDKC